MFHRNPQWYDLKNNARIVSASEINGAFRELNPMMITTGDTAKYMDYPIRASIGPNLLLSGSKYIVDSEIGSPLYQNYNGIFNAGNFNY